MTCFDQKKEVVTFTRSFSETEEILSLLSNPTRSGFDMASVDARVDAPLGREMVRFQISK